MIYTENIGLSKPELNEKYNLAESNKNLDIIDTFAGVITKAVKGVPATANGEVIALTDASNVELNNLVIYGKSTQNGTPTPTAPIEIDNVENPTVKITGKNLLENTATTQTVYGVTFTVNADGTVVANGKATSNAQFWVANTNTFLMKSGVRYKLTGSPSGGGSNSYLMRLNNLSGIYGTDTGNGAEYMPAEDVVTGVDIRIASGYTANNLVFKPMIRLASITDSTYEPYKSQSLTIPYTLNEGDYVDFEKGVFVKNSEKYQLASSMTWAKNLAGTRIYTTLPDGIEKATNSNIYCTHATKGSWTNNISGSVCLGNRETPVCGFATTDFATVDELKSWLDAQAGGVFVVVPLITPIEKPLTEAELEAYKLLHTYKPNTTISNSENATMQVDYNADTKLYLDNKFAELQTAILNNI